MEPFGPREITQAIDEAAIGMSGLDAVVLFGSFARGTSTESSDIDLAVVGDVDPHALAAELSSRVGRSVDVVRFAGAPLALLAAIVEDGVVVHRGNAHALARAWFTALLELETDLPGHRKMAAAYLSRVAERGR